MKSLSSFPVVDYTHPKLHKQQRENNIEGRWKQRMRERRQVYSWNGTPATRIKWHGHLDDKWREGGTHACMTFEKLGYSDVTGSMHHYFYYMVALGEVDPSFTCCGCPLIKKRMTKLCLPDLISRYSSGFRFHLSHQQEGTDLLAN